MPLLQNPDPETWREDFLCEHLFQHAQIPRSEGVRTKNWKYIRYFEQNPIHEELYDLRTDPTERRNLASVPEHAQSLDDLRARCDELIKRAKKGLLKRQMSF